MAQQERVRNLVRRDTKFTLSITKLLLNQIASLWRSTGSWYDGDLVLARSARSSTLVEAAQRQSRLQANAYLKQAYREMDLEFPTIDVEESYPREGVRIDEVWERPAEQYRYQKSVGRTDEEALETAVVRAEALADTDMALARRQQSAEIYRRTPKVTGYRRIIHPELSESGTCGLCVVAADRIYKISELLPIHDHCNCTTLPVTGAEDPGLSLNREDLDRLYSAAGGNEAADLSQVRIKVNEHGELGPVLSRQGQKFTEKTERRSTSSRRAGRNRPIGETFTRRQSIEAQIPALEASSEKLRARQAAGEGNLSTPLQWQTDRIAKLRKELEQIRSQS